MSEQQHSQEIRVELLDACGSTQDEARTRLADVAPGGFVAVAARSQLAGRGRGGRAWQDPPGAALLLSVARRGPLHMALLDNLPARIAHALGATLAQVAALPAAAIAWKPPNDLIDPRSAAKLAGILVDVRTQGIVVLDVVVGAGVNLLGPTFTTTDGRSATSLEAVARTAGRDNVTLPAMDVLLPRLARDIALLLSEGEHSARYE